MPRKPSIAELEAKLEIVSEALRLVEERAIAGLLALEVMHEVRAPLEALGGFNFLILAEADNSEEVRKYAHLAEEQIMNLGEVADTTLGFARTASSRKAADLTAITAAALRIHRQTIESKNIHLVQQMSGPVVANVYAGQILQVLSNLIVNALDALPRNGTMCFRVRKSKGQVDLVIADNGHGIESKYLGKIFQPFYTDKEKGTGLGLSLSKKIIDRHDGRISVRSSVRPGRSGTTFKISIPA